MARRRTCQSCSKPLGGTLAYCHECGGDNTDGGGDMTDVWGVYWKLELGVKPKHIFNHHSEENWLDR